jgi:eukaryotic-like serine/threonine-protein kinase
VSPGSMDRLLEVAAEVADGAPLDWTALATEGLLGPLDGLRRLAALQSLFVGAPIGAAESGNSALVPSRWGHLELREAIGAGSFGAVYRAFDPVLRREVALKLWREGEGGSGHALIEEARSLATVRHPHVLAVHGADIHDGRVGLWTDLLEGRNLEEELAASGPRPRGSWLEAAIALAGALEAVHGAGLVHGDVKASNVMIDRSARVILTDFGAAGRAAAGPARAGSPLSMSPELLAGAPQSASGDLYALGVLLFRLATGRYPVEAATLEELVVRHRGGPRPMAWPRRFPRAARRLVQRLLETRPERRPVAREALARLRWIEQSPGRRRLRLAVATSVAALIVLVLSSGWYTSHLASERNRARVAAERAHQVSSFLVDLFQAADPYRQREASELTARQLLDRGAERIETELATQPDVQAELMTVVGRVYTQLGLYDRGRALVDSALERRQARAADRPAELADSLEASAWLDYLTGRYDAASAKAQRALELRRRATGEDDLAVAAIHHLLGRIARRSEDPPRARRHLLRALEIRERRLPPDDLVLASTFEGLGSLEYRADDLDAALGYHQKALAIYRKKLRPDDLRMAAALGNLVQVKLELGDLDGLEPLVLSTRDIYLRKLGPDHREVGTAWIAIATLYYELGRYGESLPAFRQSLATYERAVGSKHPFVAYSLKNLGHVYRALGRSDRAVPLYERALAIRRKALGERHASLFEVLPPLALALAESGHPGQAESLLEASAATAQAVLAAQDPDWADFLVARGTVQVELGHPEAAEAPLREGAAILATGGRGARARLAEAKSALGGCLASQGRHAEAERILLESLDVLRQHGGQRARATVRRLVDLYESWGRPEAAADHRAFLERIDAEAAAILSESKAFHPRDGPS